ncbi:MAG: HD domain-containing protein [Chloroflexota bacterium]
MTPDLPALFDFIKFSAQLREISRNNNATAARKESVAEHSWHLALMAWVLHSAFEQEFGVSISQERIIKLCLMHDLVEIVVGDVSAWKPEARAAAANQEEAAAQGIFGRLPDALRDEMLGLWHEFENGATLEGKIARGIDRINPALMRMLTGQGWSDVNGDVSRLDTLQLPRLEFSTTFMELYESIKAESVASGLLKP